MKLTLVTETFPPEVNGVAMTLSHLVEGLAQREHVVTVARPRQSSRDQAVQNGLWREHLFPSVPIPGYAFLRAGLPAGRKLRQLWTKDRPDIVHIATEGPLGWSALRTARSMGLPISSSFHTNFHSYSRHYGAAWLTRPALAYLRWFHNRTQITLSPTAELNDELTRDGFRGMRLLSRGVNTAVFSPERRDDALRRSWGAAREDLVLVHVSRLAAEKNYELLHETWNAIRQADPRAKFILVSDGPLRRKLERQMPWARTTGFLPRGELAQHYASADLFVYPSQTETFGNVVTEGMASGLPVLAYHYAAPARFIRSGENGLTVPFGDRDAFLQAALRLARDPSSRQRFGAAARKTAETISWDAVIAGFERDLLSLLPDVPLAVSTR